VTSLVRTLDQKLLELSSGETEAAAEPRAADASYRDPSLHRSQSASSQLQMMNGGGPGPAPPLQRPAADHSASSNASSKKGMKRSIRELCERFEQRPPTAASARSAGSPRALKRRHTVGGSKDIDRFLRLFLAASRGAHAQGEVRGVLAVRPTSCLVELDLLPLQPVPLESRV